jgi:two-component system, NtrC family, sensor kinase
MLSNKETKLLNLIKYTPIVIIWFICIIITFLLYIEKNTILKKDLQILQSEYIDKNKEIIKNEVDKIYTYISYKKSNSEKELKVSIKNRVEEAYRLVSAIYEKYKDKETKEQIIVRIKETLRELRFNDNRGYYYIYNMQGYNILHPLQPQLENQLIINHKDSANKKIIQNTINQLKNIKEGYNELYWQKPEDLNHQYKKITFNKVFEPYDWYIGTGEYINDFENKIKDEILSYINSIQYSDNGYFIIIDEQGTYLSHIKKEYIGANRINIKDANGFMITKEILNQAKKGSGYIKYIGTIKPQAKLPSEKISYVRGFDDWKWAIATGFYTDELVNQIIEKEKEIKDKYTKNLIKFFVISILITIFFLFISFYISNKLHKRFLKYKYQLLAEIEKHKQKDSLLTQQSKMAAMGEMLENVAHQWRQPLNSISLMSTGVKVKYEYGIIEKEELIKSMDSITNTTKYLSQTIDDFRDYFNPQKEASHFNLRYIINKALTLLETQLKNKNINVIKNLDDITIFSFENEFLQVIINIINNSKDEFEKKEIKNRYIFIDIKKEENVIKVLIKDNAGGIDSKIINKIFEAHFTTKGKSQGTGIGLYMSKEIIEKHMNGKISVSNENLFIENTTYKGALFEIDLFMEESIESF